MINQFVSYFVGIPQVGDGETRRGGVSDKDVSAHLCGLRPKQKAGQEDQ
jgi:hypothetical protein